MLFNEFEFDGFSVANRIAMAPMTRSRTSQPGDVPNEMMATYYQQRASAGLIITEGAPISAVARGYSMTPGIYTEQHIAGWKKVTSAIKQQGGKAFIQLWHVGRRSHASIAGEQPVSASALKEPDQVFGPLPEGGFGMIETQTPRALTLEEISATVADFAQAAKNAILAGFDGVEIHAAHGYLIEQFLRRSSNQRNDGYGGSRENRMRLLLEVVDAVIDAIGADKVAIRVSPHVIEGFAEDDTEMRMLMIDVAKALAERRLAYLHFSENISRYNEVDEQFRRDIRAVYPNPIMVAGKLTQERAEQLIEKGYADLVAFGTPFVTNPDLVARFKHQWPLAEFDADARLTLYGGDEVGYIDYPAYQPTYI
ncbi:alkene reductase [Thaumasiovibrio subtropicus]|uniref:alkene reductase n=1 Tax=Thaumasiovibrio subtropicus TaxID=1891207 RepID=UPI000B35859B|nr:alkene reductase [Thaumasiovibrio subtropicus]